MSPLRRRTILIVDDSGAIQHHVEHVLSLDRACRHQNELGCIMLDLDHFKLVNDQHGHLVGDQVLSAVAQQLEQDLRKCDLPARYGGEEFVLLLPQTGLAGSQAVAERQRLAVAELSVSVDTGEIHPTVSLGVAAYPTHPAKSIEDLLRHADQALYRAKEAGRNRVELAVA